jgi:hypothetical protein
MAGMVSRAMTLLPIAAWIGTSKCWRSFSVGPCAVAPRTAIRARTAGLVGAVVAVLFHRAQVRREADSLDRPFLVCRIERAAYPHSPSGVGVAVALLPGVAVLVGVRVGVEVLAVGVLVGVAVGVAATIVTGAVGPVVTA